MEGKSTRVVHGSVFLSSGLKHWAVPGRTDLASGSHTHSPAPPNCNPALNLVPSAFLGGSVPKTPAYLLPLLVSAETRACLPLPHPKAQVHLGAFRESRYFSQNRCGCVQKGKGKHTTERSRFSKPGAVCLISSFMFGIFTSWCSEGACATKGLLRALL